MICTFIGHRDTPSEVEPILKRVLRELIEDRNATDFYVGTHGKFDYMSLAVLKELKNEYPHIRYTRVLAYIPKIDDGYSDYSNTIYPDGLENIPPRFAIIKRNKWMIEKSDYVVCYVENSLGNAYEFMSLALKKKKKVINLKDYAK